MTSTQQSVLCRKRDAAEKLSIKYSLITYQYEIKYRESQDLCEITAMAVKDDTKHQFNLLHYQAMLDSERIKLLVKKATTQRDEARAAHSDLVNAVDLIANTEFDIPTTDADKYSPEIADAVMQVGIDAITRIMKINIAAREQFSAINRICRESCSVMDDDKFDAIVEQRNKQAEHITNQLAAKIEQANMHASAKMRNIDEENMVDVTILNRTLNGVADYEINKTKTNVSACVQIKPKWHGFTCSNYSGVFEKLAGAQKTKLVEFINEQKFEHQRLLVLNADKSIVFIDGANFKTYLTDNCVDLNQLNNTVYCAVVPSDT